jgi:DnaJ-class molecular chaperone
MPATTTITYTTCPTCHGHGETQPGTNPCHTEPCGHCNATGEIPVTAPVIYPDDLEWCPSCAAHSQPDPDGFCPCGEPIADPHDAP